MNSLYLYLMARTYATSSMLGNKKKLSALFRLRKNNSSNGDGWHFNFEDANDGNDEDKRIRF